MQKRKILVGIIAVASLIVAACNSVSNANNSNSNITPEEVDPTPTPSQESDEGEIIKLDIETSLSESPVMKKVDITYSDAYFFKDTKTFNKKLALFAFGSASSTGSKSVLASYLNQAGFETDYFSSDWDIKPSKDTLAYAFSHKAVDSSNIIIVSIRGINYGNEFANNFLVDKEGNHAGFDNGATHVYNDLISYLNNNFQDKDIRVLINGYSRGAAISNVLASRLLSNQNGFIQDTNLYCYSYATPRGLIKENAISYKNVFNLINEADPVTHVAPSEIALYRCGVDINLYSNDVDELVSNFDEDSKLDEFVVSSNYKNEKECIKYILKTLIDSLDGTSEEEKRSSFVDKYQSTIMYMFDMFGSLSSSTIELIKSEISSHVFDLLQKDSFYNLVKHYLDIDQGFEYDPEELRHHTDTIHDLLMNIIGLQTLAELMTGNGKRLISMHYPEVEYCLLKNYSE